MSTLFFCTVVRGIYNISRAEFVCTMSGVTALFKSSLRLIVIFSCDCYFKSYKISQTLIRAKSDESLKDIGRYLVTQSPDKLSEVIRFGAYNSDDAAAFPATVHCIATFNFPLNLLDFFTFLMIYLNYY